MNCKTDSRGKEAQIKRTPRKVRLAVTSIFILKTLQDPAQIKIHHLKSSSMAIILILSSEES